MLAFSPSTKGFYSSELHAEFPEDAVEITAEAHAELLAAQAAGKSIAVVEGRVEAVERPPSARRVVPRADFMARFTADERAAMAAAAAADIVAMAAAQRIASRRAVALDDPAIRAALEDLAEAGALDAARVDELLAA